MMGEASAIEPLLYVAAAGLVAMVADWFAPRDARWPAAALLVGIALAAAAALRDWSAIGAAEPVAAFGRDVVLGGVAQRAFLIRVDALALFAALALLAFTALTVLLSLRYARWRGLRAGEYFTLVAFAAAAMMLLGYASDLVLVFLAIETFSIALYALCAFVPGSRAGLEAGLKYFVLGSFSAGFLLYGITLVYSAVGSTDLVLISSVLAEGGAPQVTASIGLALILTGLGFKIAVVPFHTWTPDVYTGAPMSVTAFMAAGTKLAAFTALMRVLWTGFGSLATDWGPALMALAVITMIGANLVALVQSDLRRLLGYSAVAHAGYVLAALSIGSSEGATAALYYLLIYGITNVGAFTVLIALGPAAPAEDAASKPAAGTDLQTATGLAPEAHQVHGRDSASLPDLAGLSSRQPWLAACMALFLVSLTGLPPAVGFLAKWYLFKAIVGAGHVWLAVVMVLASAVSAFYYLRPILWMYAVEPSDRREVSPSTSEAVALTAAATIVGFGLFLSAPLLGGAERAAAALRADRDLEARSLDGSATDWSGAIAQDGSP